jgi:hypothetical protein
MRGVIRVEVRSWTVMARGRSGVRRRCAGSPSGGPEYGPGPVSQHGCDKSMESRCHRVGQHGYRQQFATSMEILLISHSKQRKYSSLKRL